MVRQNNGNQTTQTPDNRQPYHMSRVQWLVRMSLTRCAGKPQEQWAELMQERRRLQFGVQDWLRSKQEQGEPWAMDMDIDDTITQHDLVLYKALEEGVIYPLPANMEAPVLGSPIPHPTEQKNRKSLTTSNQ